MKINTNTEKPILIRDMIKKINSDVMPIYESLRKSHNELEDTLDDKLREKIGENFNRYLDFLTDFMTSQNETVSKLENIIKALEEYENIKFED